MEWSIYEADQTMIWLTVKVLKNPFVNSFLPSNPIFFFFFFIVCWNSECIKGMPIFFFFFCEQVRNFIKLKKKKYTYKENLYKSKASYMQLAIDWGYTTVAKKGPILNNYLCKENLYKSKASYMLLAIVWGYTNVANKRPILHFLNLKHLCGTPLQ